MTGRKPNVGYFRVFGCLGWYHVPKGLRKKLDAKSEAGIVIACMENSHCKLWIPSRKVAVVSRDVDIIQTRFPARNWRAENRGVDFDGTLIDENEFVKEHISDLSQPLVQQEVARESKRGTTSVPQASGSNNGNFSGGDRNGVTPTLQELESLTHYPSVDPTVEEAPFH